MSDNQTDKAAHEAEHEVRSNRWMWIASILIVLIIAGAMGLDMIYNPDVGSAQNSTDMSTRARK